MTKTLPDALIVTAAQNIQHLSGLPFFKDTKQVWKFYPPSKLIELEYHQLIHPGWFDIKPEFIWGFYGQRSFQLAKPVKTKLFENLLKIHKLLPKGIGVITTSVNGEFLNNGIPSDRVEEIYGNLRKLQCSSKCTDDIWDMNAEDVKIDRKSRMAVTYPVCPKCNAPARPNTLLFDDSLWNPSRADNQRTKINNWLGSLKGLNVHILELGTDSVDPAIGLTTTGLSEKLNAKIFRVQPKNEKNQGPEIEQGVEEYLNQLKVSK